MRRFFFALCLLLAGCGEPAHLDISLRAAQLPPIWPQAHELLPTQPKGINPITCNCGAYQDQIVLLAHDKEVPLGALYTGEWSFVERWARDGCHTRPWDIPAVLNAYGVKTESRYYFGSAGFLALAKHSLERGHPLIVLIQATRGHHGLHWISLWGFDTKREVFLVYDSQYGTKKGGVGNTTYSIPFLESRFPWWITAAVEITS